MSFNQFHTLNMDEGDAYINNVSSSNITIATHIAGNELQSFTLIKVLFPLVSLFILICQVIAIRLLKRCKTMPYQSLRLSISYLLSDIVGTAFHVLFFIFTTTFNFKVELFQNLQIIIVLTLNNISSASLAGIIVERVVALKANLNYTLTAKRLQIRIIVALIWVTHIAIPLCVLTVSYGHLCNFQTQSCDLFKVSRLTKFTCLAIMGAYDIVLIKANLIVYKIAKGHAAQIDAMQAMSFNMKNTKIKTVSERQYASIQICLRLVSFYVLLHIPMLVLMFISTYFVELGNETSMRFLRALVFILSKVVCSVINLYLYIWKIPECKLFCYKWLAQYLKKFEKIAHDQRIEVYNIVVAFNKHDTEHPINSGQNDDKENNPNKTLKEDNEEITEITETDIQEETMEITVTYIQKETMEITVTDKQEETKEITVSCVQGGAKEITISGVHEETKEIIIADIHEETKETTVSGILDEARK